MSKVNILHLIEGAKQAEGLTVIIDVFRAISLECYLYDMGVKEIRPIGSVEEAFSLNKELPGSVLIGERHGKKCIASRKRACVDLLYRLPLVVSGDHDAHVLSSVPPSFCGRRGIPCTRTRQRQGKRP